MSKSDENDEAIAKLAALINWDAIDAATQKIARELGLSLAQCRRTYPTLIGFQVTIGERTLQIQLRLRGARVIHVAAVCDRYAEIIEGTFSRGNKLAIAAAALPVMRALAHRVAHLQ